MLVTTNVKVPLIEERGGTEAVNAGFRDGAWLSRYNKKVKGVISGLNHACSLSAIFVSLSQ